MQKMEVCSGLLTPLHYAQLPAAAAAAEKSIHAVGFESRHARAGGHVELFQHLAGLSIHSSQLALVPFPGAVPEFAIEPRDAGDETVGLERSQYRARGRIDLVNLAFAIVADPQRAFS